MSKIFLKDIERFIGEAYEVVNRNDGHFVEHLKSTLEATETDLSFIAAERKDKMELLEKSKSRIMIIDPALKGAAAARRDRAFIVVADPRKTFAHVGNRIFKKSMTYTIHPSAVIHPEASIHPEVFIGPLTCVGRAKIDAGTIVYGNVHIYDNTFIGKNVKIHAGAIIGADGFGYFKNDEGELENFPHVGGVKIEDDVEIGANTCIDRGALGYTTIRKGAKIDNLVHIAHNVVVGCRAMVIANAMVGGSTVIGDDTWVAPSASLRDAIAIGKNATVGMGAVVTKAMPDNQTWTGNPARPLEEFVALNQALKKLSS